MKAKLFRRILSIVLSVILVFSMLPFGEIAVNAVTNITDVDDMGKLGSGYNLLGDEYLGDAPMRRIFVSTTGVTAQFDSNPVSKSSYSYITSVEEYFKNESDSLSIGFGMGSEASAKLEIKIVELNVSQKYSLDVSGTDNSSTSDSSSDTTEYMLLEYMHQIGTYTMWLDSEAQISRLWQTDNNGNFIVLNEDFVNSLLNDEPADFFNNYGSHLITQYTAGGTATSSYFGEIHYESSSNSVQQNSSVFEGSEGALTRYEELEHIYESNSGDSSNETVKRGESVARGGNGNFAWDASSASEWANTVNKEHHVALVDNNLKMLPMWELLVDAGYTDRRIELEQYFNEHVDSQYADLYGKYIYSPTGVKDFTGYTFVKTADDFYNIQNDLNGKYVLVNNIDLSEYTEWNPVGTKSAPFTGVFDGNGNTISGLSIFNCNSFAGLFGYNAGIIENLTVIGNINADGTGSVNDVAYIGGIAGYNAGKISNCRNMVTVNGKLSVTEGGTVNDVTDNFFVEYATEIENAKNTEMQTLTDGVTVSVGLTPVHLTGKANDVIINISGNSENDPAIIVLENVDITGVIAHKSDRNVCIVSIGTQNIVTGSELSAAVHLSHDLYITGDAKLILNGADGKKGTDGAIGATGKKGADGLNQVRGANGGSGGVGEKGGNGISGTVGVYAETITISLNNIIIISGGDGGDGGKGGDGGVGGRGGNCNAGVIGSAGAGNGGTGGNGGDGGQGGSGANPIEILTVINVYAGDLYLYNGDAGNGGNGGTGGNGGNGGNTKQWGAYCGWAGGGGSGGYGGMGGLNGEVAKFQYESGRISVVNPDSHVYVFLGNVNSGGMGGSGGAVGSAGRSDLDRPHFANGTDYSDVYSLDGTDINQLDYSKYEILALVTQYRVYRYFDSSSTFENITNLVSIGSLAEQKLVEEMLKLTGSENESIWIGLKTIKVISGNFENGEILLSWSDGTFIKVKKENGIAVSSFRVIVDERNNITDILGESYINFAAGNPDNADNEEYCVQLTSDAEWIDVIESVFCNYITETDLEYQTEDWLDSVALFVGGICGYNSGIVETCYNTATVSADEAYSLQSGVSAYAGGISGYNNGKISYAANIGAVTSVAETETIVHYANAYAFNISAGIAGENCIGYVKPSANAQSVNALENNYSDDIGDIQVDSVKAALDKYWKNSELSIDNVTRTEYFRDSLFIKDTLDLTLNSSKVNAFTVRNNFFTPGTTTVTILCSANGNEYIRYVPVHVIEEKPQSLEIYKIPKTEFFVGDIFTYESLAVKLTFNNGNYKLLPSKMISVSRPSMNVIGKHIVTVSYEYSVGEIYTCEYEINISSVSVSGIQITKLPDKLTYTQGEQIDFTGMKVNKVYNNGTTEEISNNQLGAAYNFMNVGETLVTINYSGFTASFPCTVTCSVTDATVKVADKTGKTGGIVEVPVSISDNVGFVSMSLTITFNENILTLVEVKDTGMIGGALHSSKFSSPYQLTWANDTARENITTNGSVVVLVFKVADNAVSGNYSIDVSFNYENYDIINYDGNSVYFNTSAGNIMIKDFIYGDVNGDGNVNNLDRQILTRYLARWDDYPESIIDMNAADVNNDGFVNNLDRQILTRYLAKWDAYSELPFVN